MYQFHYHLLNQLFILFILIIFIMSFDNYQLIQFIIWKYQIFLKISLLLWLNPVIIFQNLLYIFTVKIQLFIYKALLTIKLSIKYVNGFLIVLITNYLLIFFDSFYKQSIWLKLIYILINFMIAKWSKHYFMLLVYCLVAASFANAFSTAF